MRMTIAGAAAVLLLDVSIVAPRTQDARPHAQRDAAGEDPVERGTLRLHYVQKPIGYERYTIARAGDGTQTLQSDVDFTDRGGRVQLTATLRTKADLTPIAFRASGKSYRFVNVDSDVRVDGS